MRHSFIALCLLGMVTACSSTQYRNVNHPNYGNTEYNSDLAGCRKENSTTTTTQGYDVQIHVDVDEARAASCMTQRGWQPISK
jgi:hypothetical protein